ncbi:uncharacterized protein LOC125369919 [Ricinus communis]|uniref:uncharacterized protein LOC125369919 n=1 Tax=Ricinus communis TaxID=3988 RepID=UPI00201A9CD1|nr:uncharacterized protein LOC125369919 [Ricinus communis]
MPKYTKFLKEILSNKKRLEDLGLVILNEECSAILQNKLPVKRRDPRNFTVPYVIGELPISSALADLGSSINLMPTSLFDRLDLSEPKPTRMSIQLADRTIKILRDIVEDVLIKVEKLIFPVDFIIIDIEGESVMPLILGRPFLTTFRAVIDVYDVIESYMHKILLDDPLQVALQGDEKELSNEQVLEQLACLLASEPSRSTNPFISLDRSDMQKMKPSIEDPPVLELKELPKHISYAYLDKAKRLLVIVAADFTPEDREMTLSSLRKYPTAFAYKIADIPGIYPSFARTRS